MIIQSQLQSPSYLSKSLLPRWLQLTPTTPSMLQVLSVPEECDENTGPQPPDYSERKRGFGSFHRSLEDSHMHLTCPPQTVQLWGQAPALPPTKTLSTGSNAFGTNMAQDNPTQEEHGKYLSSYILLLSQRPLMLVTCQPLMPHSLRSWRCGLLG